jgi:hypothetical protein
MVVLFRDETADYEPWQLIMVKSAAMAIGAMAHFELRGE